jgi:processive 1,2-diacylglycerol beta-glucosyltransferase
MSVSDLIVTKPGGLTITEAIIKELPIVVSSSLPGQEERNIEFILNNSIGMLATSPNSLISCIKSLKKDEEKYNSIKLNMSKLKKPKASYDIANLILSLKRKS